MICTTAGDAGDLCFLCGIIKAIPSGPHSLLIEEVDEYTAQKSRQRSEMLLKLCGPLVEQQPYIKECRMIAPGDAPNWRSGGFRKAGLHDPEKTLLSAHLRHLNLVTRMGLVVDVTKPWLSVKPSPETGGMVVINRTSRYQNGQFQWRQIVDHYRGRIVFVGLPHEHKAFCASYGFVSYRETKNLLDLAQLIAGSSLFIGNQSVANAICEGLKHALIQEPALNIPDCVFLRSNAQHAADGSCFLPDVSGSGSKAILAADASESGNTSITPHDGWHHGGKRLSMSFRDASAKLVATQQAESMEDAGKRLIAYNALRVPRHFKNRCMESRLAKFHQAVQNATKS